MTENKRFYKQKSTIEDYMIYDDDKEDAYFISCKDESDADYLVVLLNELNDENEQLKKDCTVLIYHNQDYRKENEQLKHKLKSLNDNFNHLKRLFDEIEEPISDELLAEYSRIVVGDLE